MQHTVTLAVVQILGLCLLTGITQTLTEHQPWNTSHPLHSMQMVDKFTDAKDSQAW